jgi:hypothetical protein
MQNNNKNNKYQQQQQQQQSPPPAECGLFKRVGALFEKYHLKVGCIKVKNRSNSIRAGEKKKDVAILASGGGNPNRKKDEHINNTTTQCHQGRSRSGYVCLSSPLL